MVIQVDSREKAHAITRIIEEFDRQGIKHPISKLIVGDYLNLDRPKLIVDRKQSLGEVVSNLTQQHARFRRELELAQELGIQLIILVEHGAAIRSIDDVEHWINPRIWAYCREHGISTNGDVMANIREYVSHGGQKPPQSGEWLAKTMRTVGARYGVRWCFCDKKNTGRRIIQLLGGGDAEK